MECKNYPNCDTNFSSLIEQQAERIKELEAERDLYKRSCESLVEANKNLNQTLAALRQRIDDAPVVAWAGSEVRSVSPGVTKTTMTGPLISKEDLL